MKQKVKKMILLELGIIFLVLILFIIIKYRLYIYIPSCIVKEKFGIICPSCGGTRCVINLLNGNYIESFLYHPIFFITIIYLFIVNILYIVNSFRKKEILSFLYPKTIFWITFVIVLIIYTVIKNLT